MLSFPGSQGLSPRISKTDHLAFLLSLAPPNFLGIFFFFATSYLLGSHGTLLL